MGLLISNCLKGVYDDLPTALAQPFHRPAQTRKEALESLLANKDAAEVDGRRNTTQPAMLADTWRSATIDSPTGGSADASREQFVSDKSSNNQL